MASPFSHPFPLNVNFKRTATLPYLTHLEILAYPADCALALAHLDLPALTILYITAKSGYLVNRVDIQMLLPYVVRHAHGPQDAQPLQSVLIRSDENYADILAWPVPDIDVEIQDPPTLLSRTLPARVTLSFLGRWRYTPTTCIGMAIVALPLESVVTFVAQDFKKPLDEESWLLHLLKWPLLRRVRLAAPVEGAFKEMLVTNSRSDSLLLPSLRELAFVDKVLCDGGWEHALTVRLEQGVPLDLLDLRMHTPFQWDPAVVEILSKLAVNVLGPEKTSEERERIRSIWKTVGSSLFIRDVDFGEGDSDHSSADGDSDNDQW